MVIHETVSSDSQFPKSSQGGGQEENDLSNTEIPAALDYVCRVWYENIHVQHVYRYWLKLNHSKPRKLALVANFGVLPRARVKHTHVQGLVRESNGLYLEKNVFKANRLHMLQLCYHSLVVRDSHFR